MKYTITNDKVYRLIRFAFYQFIIMMTFAGVCLAQEKNARAVLEKEVSISYQNTTVKDILKGIEKQANVRFAYSANDVNLDETVSYQAESKALKEVLEQLLAPLKISYEVKNEYIILTDRTKNPTNKPEGSYMVLSEKTGQITSPITIRGRVTDEEGLPLPGATVLIKGTYKGITTDKEGNFVIKVPDSKVVLVFSYVGFKTQEITVETQRTINIVLKTSTSSLDEVVVIGYGTQEKAKVTGSISKVKAEDIKNNPTVSLDQALQGQATGLFINNSSGAPGAPPLIRIRGQNSINSGNEPLFVIDGIPFQNGSPDPLDNFPRSQNFNILSSINVNDIESVEILKDASATAIYGSRAANGVILITTKKGKEGKTSLNINISSGLSMPINTLDLLNSEQYVEIKSEAFINDGLPVPDELLNANTNINTDWQDELYRTALLNDFQISANGGSEKVKYFLSGSYRNEEATILVSKLQRATLRSNIDVSLTDKLDVGTNIFLSRENNRSFAFGQSAIDPIESSQEAIPYNPVRDENGEFVPGILLFGFLPVNPIAELVGSNITGKTSRVLANSYFDYEISPNLNFRTNASVDYTLFETNVFYSDQTFSGSSFGTQGRANKSIAQTEIYNIEPTLTYANNFNENHSLNGLLGVTFYNSQNRRIIARSRNFIRQDLHTISSGAIRDVGDAETEYSYNSIFGRMNYDFDSKYIFSATIRWDGSSRFGKENRYGTFWALSGGWVFSEEKFTDNSRWLEFGKLRVSYGTTGNDQIGNFASSALFGTNFGYDGVIGLNETQLGNPALSWEETAKFNLGLDLSLFKNRLNITMDYFLNKTNDLILSTPLTGVTGFRTISRNIGDVENKGWELGINATIVSTKDFNWTSSFNITFVKNKILRLVSDEQIFSINGISVQKIGQPINSFWGLDFLGVDPQTGNAIYRDVNGNGVFDQAEDRTIIGNPLPDFYGGLSNTLSYKGLSLDIFLQFVSDIDIYDNSAFLFLLGGVDNRNQHVAVLDRWQQPGDITNIPRVTTNLGRGNNNRFSSRHISDASYLRVKNITLSYKLPSKILESMGIRALRIYLTGTNLFTITDYPWADPEIGSGAGGDFGNASGNLVQSKSFILGLEINF